MRRLYWVLFVLIFAGGCHSHPPANKIAVGMNRSEALRRLDSSGAKDITSNVGIRSGFFPDQIQIEDLEDHWYILSDNTCIHLTSGRRPGAADSLILSMELGDKGTGYGGKMRWFEKQTHLMMKEIEL